MGNKNAEQLFEYLRSILFDEEIIELNTDELDTDFQKLGEGMQYLAKCVREMLGYTKDLSTGNLSVDFPPKDNMLCVNLKNLHANLNHLSWQAKQVAQGDYNQHVAYLGEFSEAFNMMISQLNEREGMLKHQSEVLEVQSASLQQNVEMFEKLTKRMDSWIIVVSAEKKEILYCNKNDSKEPESKSYCHNCPYKMSLRQVVLQHTGHKDDEVWEYFDEKSGRYFEITTFFFQWKGNKAYAYLAEDITQQKQEEQHLEAMAFKDSLTGLYNRHYFLMSLEKVFIKGLTFCLCYIDIDGLKFVNDHYGHVEGDSYIHLIVKNIQSAIRPDDVFARVGGDEFIILFGECEESVVERKMNDCYEKLVAENNRHYPVSFSFGVVEYNGGTESLEELIEMADERMYEFKEKHKNKQYNRQNKGDINE